MQHYLPIKASAVNKSDMRKICACMILRPPGFTGKMPALGKFLVNAQFFQHGARRSDSFREGHAAVHSGKGKGNIDKDIDIDTDTDIKKSATIRGSKH